MERKSSSTDELPAAETPSAAVVVDGRFYECVFCRRGFSTAQALGGHMNIHRRDRARMLRGSEPPPRKRSDDAIASSSPVVVEPAMSSHALVDREVSRRPRELSLFSTEEAQSGAMHGDSHSTVHRALMLQGEEEEEPKEEGDQWRHDHEVDLELRLGHDP